LGLLTSDNRSVSDNAIVHSPEAPIKVVVLGAVCLICQSLAALLGGVDEIEVAGLADGFDEALDQIHMALAHVVMLDFPCGGGIDVVRELAVAAPASNILILGLWEEQREPLAWVKAGAVGWVSPHDSVDDVIDAIKQAAAGQTQSLGGPRPLTTPVYVAETVASTPSSAADGSPRCDQVGLTARELAVLELVDRGLSNKEVASVLSIEVATVKNHVHHVLEKLDLRRRTQAMAWYRSRQSMPIGGVPRVTAREQRPPDKG
jgi:two-component system, NarL family, nitrate/nitrite response regulator NarL